MIVAINTRFMLSGKIEGIGIFIYETFSRIARQHPEHEFIYIFDQPFNQQFITSTNIKGVVLSPSAKYPLLWKYWYEIRIPSILKKIKADVFVSCDGFCSLKTAIPQCLIMDGVAYLHEPLLIKKSHAAYRKKYTPKYLSKANKIVAFSNYLKDEIVGKYFVDESKIQTAYYGAREIFQPLSITDKELIKIKYTEGKEFFVYSGTVHSGKNLMMLLKAFSVFKKRQQTNMKLVLAGSIDPKYESLKKDLQSYKFKNDVVVFDNLKDEELVNLIGAAYGFVVPSFIEEYPVLVIEAMKMGVPVIAVETNTMKEIANDAVLYSEKITHIALAEKMMLLYKDERLRNNLILKGIKNSATYSWDKTTQLLWQIIQKAIS